MGRKPEVHVITDELLVGSTELALTLGLTARRVRQLAQDGILPTAANGKYRLCESVQRYITYITGDNLTDDDIEIEKARKKAETQIKMAKADVAKLEARELQGKMHRSEDVQAITEDMANTLRGLLLALPGRLAVDVANARDAAEASVIIRNAVYEVMDEMNQYHYSPEKYEARVRERRRWEQEIKASDNEQD